MVHNITKKTKEKIEKNAFVSEIQNLFFENEFETPKVSILTSQPRKYQQWKYQTFYQDVPAKDPIEIFVLYENFEMDGNLITMILKNKLQNGILNILVKFFACYQTLSTVRLENCALSPSDIDALHEMLVTNWNIKELSVDGNPVIKHYIYVVLSDTNIEHISLQRCNIDDYATKLIFDQLKTTEKQTLVSINLTCNQIGDEGACYIADALRLNHSLVFLILTDNWISNSGFITIINTFQNYSLTEEENIIKKKLNIAYFKVKFDMLEKIKNEEQLKLSSQLSVQSKKKPESLSSKNKTLSNIRSVVSTTKKLNINYPGSDHHFITNCYSENGETFCRGNFKVSYLNMAYNKIQGNGFNALLGALKFQQNAISNVAESGLLYVIMDGNSNENHEIFEEIKLLLAEKRIRLIHKSKMSIKNVSFTSGI